MKERTKLALILAVFAACWFLPTGSERFWSAVHESLSLVNWYAQEHVLLCLVPAFFIAGAISVFVSQGAVMKYLGPKARKLVAYPVAAVSGTILAVCSCTVLPLFASIHKRGAGLGPATAFLYSGPAINILAIILTAASSAPSWASPVRSVPSRSPWSLACSCTSSSARKRLPGRPTDRW